MGGVGQISDTHKPPPTASQLAMLGAVESRGCKRRSTHPTLRASLPRGDLHAGLVGVIFKNKSSR
jgi:hypothetical protein